MSLQKAEKTMKVALISLGCAKNLVDAEIMLGSLLKAGVEITSEPTLADALIVNTCSFIEAAQQEAVDTILEAGKVRDAHRPEQALIVAGCLPQRFRDELPRLLPEVDAFIGIDQVSEVAGLLQKALAHRREHLTASDPKNKQEGRRSQITGRLSELEHEGVGGKNKGTAKEQNSVGTILAGSLVHYGRWWIFMCGQASFLISERRGIG